MGEERETKRVAYRRDGQSEKETERDQESSSLPDRRERRERERDRDQDWNLPDRLAEREKDQTDRQLQLNYEEIYLQLNHI